MDILISAEVTSFIPFNIMNPEYVPATLSLTLPEELEFLNLAGQRVTFTNPRNYDFGTFVYEQKIPLAGIIGKFDNIFGLVRTSVYPDAILKYQLEIESDKRRFMMGHETVDVFEVKENVFDTPNLYSQPTSTLTDGEIKDVISKVIIASPGNNKYTLRMEIEYKDIHEQLP